MKANLSRNQYIEIIRNKKKIRISAIRPRFSNKMAIRTLKLRNYLKGAVLPLDILHILEKTCFL